jgi:hypothetical protein
MKITMKKKKIVAQNLNLKIVKKKMKTMTMKMKRMMNRIEKILKEKNQKKMKNKSLCYLLGLDQKLINYQKRKKK